MGLLGLSLVAGLVGWGAQVPVAALANAGAAKSPLAQVDLQSGNSAKNKPTANSRDNKQTPAKPANKKQAPEETAAPGQTAAEDICRTIAQAAAENQLPVNFFTRVIWQESHFDAHAAGRKGAKGIAQFMPETADFRGLGNPFDPISSIETAARYLGDLRKMFGNLGLAAAGYNAGPGRVREWLDGKRALPNETRNYVAITTGWTADEWSSPSPPKVAETTTLQGVPCSNIDRLVLAPLNGAPHERFGNPGLVAVCYPERPHEWLDRKRALIAVSLKQPSPRTLVMAPHYPSWCHGLNHPNLSVCGPVHAGGSK